MYKDEAVADQDLIRSVEDVVAELYEAEFERLGRFAAFLIGDWHGGQDLVAEVFQKAQKAWVRHGLPASTGAYLHAAVVNAARTVRTRRKPERSGVLSTHDSVALSAEAIAVLREDERRVIVALSSLPQRQRECLVLRYYFGFSDVEVARSLDISVGTAKTHLRRGLAALRKMLKETRDD